MADIGKILGAVTDFAGLQNLSTLERIRGLAQAGRDVVQQFDRAVEEGKATLSARDMEEVRLLREQIVPRAIAAGKKLDEKLGAAATR